MLRSTVTTMAALGGLGVIGVIAPGCVERVIYEQLCNDGRLSRGEVCLGEGERSTVTIDSLAPLALRVSDFDGDGPPDLMVLGTDAAGAVTARLWHGDGEGGFASPLDPRVFGCSAHPAPGSIDDDGITDLLVADCAPSMSLFRGSTSGVFEPPVSVFTGVTPIGSGMFDLDGDGRREVVVLGLDVASVPTVSVVERDSSGAFAPPIASPMTGLPGFRAEGFGVIDFDGDAFPDLLVVDAGNPSGLAIARGADGLRFGAPEQVGPPDLGPDGATTTDLDGDGRLEVLAVSFEADVYIVLEVEGTGPDATLVERTRTELPGLEPSAAALADLDGDGRLDLLRVEPGRAKLEARLGERDGGFGEATEIDVDTPADQIAVADLDQDGAADVVVGSFAASQLRVLLTLP